MNTVYILIAMVYSGHFTHSIVPTLEFKTLEKCEAAVSAFEKESDNKSGSARMRCVRIEK